MRMQCNPRICLPYILYHITKCYKHGYNQWLYLEGDSCTHYWIVFIQFFFFISSHTLLVPALLQHSRIVYFFLDVTCFNFMNILSHSSFHLPLSPYLLIPLSLARSHYCLVRCEVCLYVWMYKIYTQYCCFELWFIEWGCAFFMAIFIY